MRIDIYDVPMFRCFFDVIHDVSDDNIVLKFLDDGLYINLLNRSHTQFFTAKYDSSFFDEYSVSEPCEVVIDTHEFFKILKSARKGESLAIEITDDSIKYMFGALGERVIETPLVGEDVSLTDLPSIDLNTSVDFALSDLKPVLTDIDKIVNSEQVVLKTTDNDFLICSAGDSLVDYNNRVHDAFVEGEDASARFSVKFLQDLCKFRDVNDNINFQLGDDLPLCWKVCSVDGFVECKGLIAPRIGEE